MDSVRVRQIEDSLIRIFHSSAIEAFEFVRYPRNGEHSPATGHFKLLTFVPYININKIKL